MGFSVLFVWLASSAVLVSSSPQTPTPSASMDQGKVTLHPSSATFQIPDEVFTDRRTPNFTRYLTRADLERIKSVDPPNWDAPYSRILNAALPFTACVAHVGGEPWGVGSKMFGDLQIRVYVIDGPAGPVRERVDRDGMAEAATVFPAAARLPAPALTTPPTGNAWSLSRISYLRNGGDFAAGVNLDFYIREFGPQTVVIFMHYPPATRLQTWDPIVAKIVDSFTWPK